MTTYLEISGRQSGKTQRLIAAVENHAASNGMAVLVVGDGMLDVVKGRLAQVRGPEERPPVLIISYSWMSSEVAELLKILEPYLPSPRWFFDEFDWHDGVPVKDGAYYCTTARYLRNQDASAEGDTLLTLVEKLGKPVLQMPSPISKEDAEEYSDSETERALLFGGQYMEPLP